MQFSLILFTRYIWNAVFSIDLIGKMKTQDEDFQAACFHFEIKIGDIYSYIIRNTIRSNCINYTITKTPLRLDQKVFLESIR